MAFDPTIPDLLRTGTGLLWLALGVALARAREDDARPVGHALVAFGGAVFVDNAVGMFGFGPATGPEVWAKVASALIALPGLIVVFVHLRKQSEGRVPLLIACAGAIVGLTAELVSELGLAPVRGSVGLASVVDTYEPMLLASFALAALAHHAARRARVGPAPDSRLAWLAVGLAIYPVVWAIGQADPGDGTATVVAYGELVSALAVALAVAFTVVELARRGSAAGRLPLVVLVASAVIAAGARVAFEADLGDRGIARAAAFAILAFALRDAFARAGSDPTGRRGTMAAGSLAALFIVAQVAQNFLSAQYGLLMGGVVAGALLVAARPIERALEGRHHRTLPIAGAAADDDRRASYRAALRKYLRDGVVSREEEVELARLARHLGLPHEDVVRLRHEVEDELAPKERVPT